MKIYVINDGDCDCARPFRAYEKREAAEEYAALVENYSVEEWDLL